MTHVYILTIRDEANFCRVEHHSVHSTYDGAALRSAAVVHDLIARDAHHGLGDTFSVDICQMEVDPA